MIRLSMRFIKNLLSTNLILKSTALTLGCSLWFLLSQQQYRTLSVTIPLCVYNEPENCLLQMPDTVMITVSARLIDLIHLNPAQLAVHIDGSSLQQPTNFIMINDTNLFLPEPIKLLHWSPSPLQISISNKQETTACIT